MSIVAYPEYKDSGVPWLGNVPSHWDAVPLRKMARLTTGLTPPTEDAENFANEGIPWLRPEDLCETGAPSFASKFVSQKGYAHLRPMPAGSTLICCIGTIGKVGIVDEAVTFNQQITAAEFEAGRERFGFWSLVTARETLEVFSTGNVLRILNTERLGRVQLPNPPFKEASAIAAFLDRETAKIDALVAEQQRLIALLKEKRQAVISHAVTKGLNLNAPMKDSGIEWLGEIPAHWDMLPLTRVVEKFVDYRGATPNKVDEGVPLITATQIKNGRIDHDLDPVCISEAEYATRMTRGFPKRGDLLLTTEAPLGECALIEEERVAPGQRIILMKMEPDIMSSHYLLAHFRSQFGQAELWTRASGSTASGIRADRLRASNVLIPPLQEQDQIVAHISDVTSEYDGLFAEAQCAITLLQERRAALISAAVTGKIDVRRLSLVELEPA